MNVSNLRKYNQSHQRRFLLSVAIIGASLFAGEMAHGATAAWSPLVGNGSWSLDSNWVLPDLVTPTVHPNAIGDIADLSTNNVGTTRVITLDVPITLGTLIIGDTAATFRAITISGTNTLTLQNTGILNAQINKPIVSNTITDSISVPIALNSNLTITNDATTGILALARGLQESGGVRSIVKEGAGPVTLGSAGFFSTYTGNTTINAGTLTPQNTAGTSSAQIPNGVGTGDVILGASGTLSLVSNEYIGGLSGSGTVAMQGATARSLFVGDNNNNTTFSGTVSASPLLFSKVGSGTLTFSGTNLSTAGDAVSVSATRLFGGLMEFDYTINNTDKTPSGKFIGFFGGNLLITPNGSADTTQNVAGALVNEAAILTINRNAGANNTTFNLNAISRSNVTFGYGALQLVYGGTGTGIAKATTTNVNTNGILPSFITLNDGVNGTNWAVNSGGDIIALASYTTLASSGNSAAVNHIQSGSLTLGGAAEVSNSLKITTSASGQSLNLGANSLTLTSGGLLFTGAHNYSIANGSLQSASFPAVDINELIVQHFGTGDLTISAAITNGTGVAGTVFTKAGTGTVILASTSNSYTNTTTVGMGMLKLGASGVIPDASFVNIGAHATLDLNGNNETIGGLGTTAVPSLAVIDTTNGDATLTINNTITSADYGGVIQDSTGVLSLVINGTPTSNQQLSNDNTFTGTTTILSGKLTLRNSNSLQNSTVVNNVNTPNGLIFNTTISALKSTSDLKNFNTFTLGGLSGTGDIALVNAGIPINLRVGNNNSPTAYTGVLSGIGSFVKIGADTTTLAGVNTYTGNTTVSSGTLDIASAGSIDTSVTVIVNASGSLITDRVRNAVLTVDGTATMRLNGGTVGASKVENLIIGAGGKLNLKDNDLVVGTVVNVNAVRAAIKTGVAGAVGITSDLSAFGVTTGFGYALGNDAALSPLLAGSLTGQTYDADSVLVKYTFLGDADLDGDSDLNDLGLWAQSFTGDLGNPVTPVTFWTSGDFDYDGDTDLNDLGFWAGTFTGDLGSGAGSLIVVAPGAPAGAVAVLNSMGITVVPEPSTYLFAAVGLAGLGVNMIRRRRSMIYC